MVAGPKEPKGWVCLGLMLLVVLIYVQVAWHEFVGLDDPIYVYENRHVLDGLSGAGMWWAFTSWQVGHWHPLTWLSLMLDAQVYGTNAGGFHLTNLFFHAINVLLLLAVLRQMTGALWPSALVAALFAVHPLHVESVAWVTERKDVLSTTFWMLTLLAYTAYARQGGLGRYLLVALLLAMGLMAKPMLVTLPCVLLLLDFWPLGRRLRLSIFLEKLPLLALSAASSVMVVLAQHRAGSLGTIEDIRYSARTANALVAYVAYLGKMIWPAKLACFYPHPAYLSHAALASLYAAAVAAGLLLALVTCLVIYFAWRRPYLAVGWFWYVGTLVPVIGLVSVGTSSMADRFTYVPLLGIYIMIAWGTADLTRLWSVGRVVTTGTSLFVLAALTTVAWFQVGTWRNSLVMYDHALRVTTHNPYVHNNRGLIYEELGQYDLALADYAKAIELKPNFAMACTNRGITYRQLGKPDLALADFGRAIKLDPDRAVVAYYNRGLIYQGQGKVKLALDNYDRAIEQKPDYLAVYSRRGLAYAQLGQYKLSSADCTRAIAVNPTDAHAYCYRGIAHAELGQFDQALADYAQAIELKPHFALAYYSRGRAYVRLRQFDQALTDYDKAIELQPEYPDAYSNRGIAYVQLDQYELALADFTRAIELNPDNPQVYNNLARLLATCPDSKIQDGQQAIAAARRACDLSGWVDFNTLNMLAATHAQAGQFAEAVEWQTKAVELAPVGARDELRRRLQRYKERATSSE